VNFPDFVSHFETEKQSGEWNMSLAQAFDHQLGLFSIANATPIIFVIGDNISVRNSLAALIRFEGWQVETFASAREFLARPRPLVPSCLLVAISLPDLNSLEVQKQLSRKRAEPPIVVISGHADVPMQAMKAQAVDFLLSSFSDAVLVGAICESLERSRTTLHREMEIRDTRDRYESLSRRERQVMKLVVSGLLDGGTPMRRITFWLIAITAPAVFFVSRTPGSGKAREAVPPVEASPIYGVTVPPGYRDWKMIAVAELKTDKVDQLRAQLGNEIAVKAYEEKTRPLRRNHRRAALESRPVGRQQQSPGRSIPRSSIFRCRVAREYAGHGQGLKKVLRDRRLGVR
jgi:FixJ family two-component response regulator